MRTLIFIACAGFAFPAYAEPQASADMPIRVNIIQCGTQKEAIKRCLTDEPRCCPLISTAAGEPEELTPDDGGNYE